MMGNPFLVSSAVIWADENMSLNIGDTRHRRSLMTKKSTPSNGRKVASALADESKGSLASIVLRYAEISVRLFGCPVLEG